ncbi:MAG: hypothetical protein ACRC5A_04605 [Enterobacteriaceae bacterium]
MMRLKKKVLDIVADDGRRDGVLFDVPPLGNPCISETHAVQLSELCEQIKARIPSVIAMTCSPHRVGQHSCLAVTLEGAGTCVNLLLTLTGTLRWPTHQDYTQAPRWYINLSDAVDAIYLVMQLAEHLGVQEPKVK